jgi:hypothetical protein
VAVFSELGGFMFKQQLKYLRAVANRWFGGDLKKALKHACRAYSKFQRKIRGIANLFFGACLDACVRALHRFLVGGAK